MINKPRVMYLVPHYPAISESYIQTEIDGLRDEYEIEIISLNRSDFPNLEEHCPFSQISEPALIREFIEEFQPQVIHFHLLDLVPFVAQIAREVGVSYSLRAHSYDAIWDSKNGVPAHIEAAVNHINDDLCLGLLSFPFTRAALEDAGIKGEKIHDSYPVVNYDRFNDRSANGPAVMGGGIGMAKKNLREFIESSATLPQLEFNLYVLGHDVDDLRKKNESLGNHVNIVAPVQPKSMLAEYKKHRWLIHTASDDISSRGWPMMIAEAQASGVGVCMRNLRPDVRTYVGGGAFLYDSIAEVRDIISKPFPEEMRQVSFEQAKKSDFKRNRHLLTDLWVSAISEQTRSSVEVLGVDPVSVGSRQVYVSR